MIHFLFPLQSNIYNHFLLFIVTFPILENLKEQYYFHITYKAQALESPDRRQAKLVIVIIEIVTNGKLMMRKQVLACFTSNQSAWAV